MKRRDSVCFKTAPSCPEHTAATRAFRFDDERAGGRCALCVSTEDDEAGMRIWWRLTFELRRDRRQGARPARCKMNHCTARAWWLAVGPRLERGVRPHCAVRDVSRHVFKRQGRTRAAPGTADVLALAARHRATEVRVPRQTSTWTRTSIPAFRARPPAVANPGALTRSAARCWKSPKPLAVLVSARGMTERTLRSTPQPERDQASCGELHFGVGPNVRAKRATTAGRQARAGENVPRTARPGLVACRWRSA